MLVPMYGGDGGGPGVAKIICMSCGSLFGAGAVLAPAFDRFLNSLPLRVVADSPLPLRVVAGFVVGGFLGWLICFLADGSQKDNAYTLRTITKHTREAAADYPRWLVTLFPVSLGAFTIGLLSALYIMLAGFSSIALAGTYLIPLGLMALYYLLGAAERRASK